MTMNREQQRVYEWINSDLGLPVFAEAYKGAAMFLTQKPPGYISFVAHAGRDLMNGLAPKFVGIKSALVPYTQHIDKLQEVWRDEWRISDDLSPEEVEKGHFIPVGVCKTISDIIDDHKSGRKRSAEADGLFFSTFLDYSDKDKIPGNFLTEWKAAKNWFVRHAHLRGESFRTETDGELVKHFNCLDDYLYIAASSQYERLKNLHAILEETNK